MFCVLHALTTLYSAVCVVCLLLMHECFCIQTDCLLFPIVIWLCFVGVRINIIMYPVLMGVIRMSTFPLLVGEVESFEDHMDTLFKVVHVGPVATGIQVGGSCGWRFKAEPVINHSLLQSISLHLICSSSLSVPLCLFLRFVLSVCPLCILSLHYSFTSALSFIFSTSTHIKLTT